MQRMYVTHIVIFRVLYPLNVTHAGKDLTEYMGPNAESFAGAIECEGETYWLDEPHRLVQFRQDPIANEPNRYKTYILEKVQ